MAPSVSETKIVQAIVRRRAMNWKWPGMAVPLLLAAGSVTWAQGNFTGTDPAMNAPEQTAWTLFLQANAGTGAAAFESWASDTDTFKPNPTFPSGRTVLRLHAPVVPMLGRLQFMNTTRARLMALQSQPKMQLAPGIDAGASEETRRNRPAFDFIVKNNLYSISGLKAAFGKAVIFPQDAMEVKANWLPVAQVPAFTLNRVALADVPKAFHVSSDSQGHQFALLSMHVISKQVPNWTWATFENRYNPARCDIIGCHDAFGSSIANVAPNAKPGTGYPDCPKTAALTAMFSSGKADPVFANYCLKGEQTDFTDNTGLAIRLGNSITEAGFVDKSSCITCHSSAGWDKTGASLNDIAPIGAMNPAWFWRFTGSPPVYQGKAGTVRTGSSADFVWSIPFCAYDDSNPAKPQATPCAGK
jgi:hypothetical protein